MENAILTVFRMSAFHHFILRVDSNDKFVVFHLCRMVRAKFGWGTRAKEELGNIRPGEVRSRGKRRASSKG